MARPTDSYLCFDLGGTKLKAALVNAEGRIRRETCRMVNQSRGFKGLIADFVDLSRELKLKASDYKSIAVASAGPLHPERGILLDPTNFFTDDKSWGVRPLVTPLARAFKKPVSLENDAAAAVLAEHWKGGHGRKRNLLVMTLGTGVGIGVIANGRLVRAGRGLHPEASHLPLNLDDHSRPCGCGAFGCIEAYLGGSHFTRRMSLELGRDVDGAACLAMAAKGNATVLTAFAAYGQRLAESIRVLSVLFAPEVVVLAGGFSHAWPYFLNRAEAELPQLMARYRKGIDLLPKIKVSKIQENAGVIGAAYVAMQRK